MIAKTDNTNQIQTQPVPTAGKRRSEKKLKGEGIQVLGEKRGGEGEHKKRRECGAAKAEKSQGCPGESWEIQRTSAIKGPIRVC